MVLKFLAIVSLVFFSIICPALQLFWGIARKERLSEERMRKKDLSFTLLQFVELQNDVKAGGQASSPAAATQPASTWCILRNYSFHIFSISFSPLESFILLLLLLLFWGGPHFYILEFMATIFWQQLCEHEWRLVLCNAIERT